MSLNSISRALVLCVISTNEKIKLIEKLINDAKVFALRKKYEDFNEIKVIDFNPR